MKKIKKIIASIMTGVITFSSIIITGCAGDKTGNVPVPPPQTEQTEQSSGFDVSGSQESGISLLTATIAETDYETYGVSAEAESAIEITATVTPAYATNVALDWSVSFAKTDDSKYEAWATGKNVSDYVMVTPTSNGGNSAIISNFEAFGAPIDITVTSRDNSEVSATLTCHYYQRVTGISLNFQDSNYLPIDNIIYDQMTSYRYNFMDDIEVLSQPYTLADSSLRVGCRVFMTEEWKNAIETEGLELDQDAEKRNVYYCMEINFVGSYGIEMLEVALDNERILYQRAMQKLGVGTNIGMVYFFVEGMRNREGLQFDLILGDDFYVPVENVSFTDAELTF